MIRKIIIKNFQSHKHTVIDLSEGMNVIVGASTTGKTAIFRAINWLINNRPLGFRFHSRFAGSEPTSVEVETDDNHVVKIEKSSEGGCTYTVDGHVFKSVGTNVPDVVKSALAIDAINFQDQLSEHFLITSSAGEVARVFNKIINIERVDRWVSKLTTKINTLNDKIATAKTERDLQQEKLATYSNLTALERDIAALEKLHERYSAVSDETDSLQSLVDNITSVEESIKQCAYSKELEDAVLAVSKQYEELRSCREEITLLEEAQTAKKSFDDLHADICWFEPLVQTMCGQLSELKSCENDILFLEQSITSITTLDNKIELLSADIAEYLHEYEAYLLEVGVCPLCLSRIDKGKAKEIVKNV